MASEILYSWGPGETRLAVVKDGRLVDLAVLRPDQMAGAVVLGRVVELAPKQGAAFVDIGQDRPAWLQGVKGLTRGEAVLAQVKADAQGGKGATLTPEIQLPGRYVAWVPSRPGIAIPRKLTEDKRDRLGEILAELITEEEGISARTHAIHASETELAAEIEGLRAAWDSIEAAAAGRPPAMLWRPDPLERLLAEHSGVSRILVDDDQAYADSRARWGELVERHRGGNLFDLHDVEDAIAQALAPVVPLACGGRVHFETTAALTAIDVDAGSANPAEANTQAVPVIARQLRLRNIAGQMVVDFVSGGGKGTLFKLVSTLKQAVSADPVATHVIGVTALGLVEMTRERRGRPLAEMALERSIHANAESLALNALRRAMAEAAHRPGKALALAVAPAVAEALARLPHAVAEAEARLGRKLTIRSEPSRTREDVLIEETAP